MERPTGVTILAILSFIGAGLMALGACAMFFLGAAGMAAAAGGRAMGGGMLAALGAFAGVAFLILAVIYVVNGIGLWKLFGWGRLLMIVLVTIGIIFGLFSLVKAISMMHIGQIVWGLIVLAIDVWILTYMFKPHVKRAFGQ